MWSCGVLEDVRSELSREIWGRRLRRWELEKGSLNLGLRFGVWGSQSASLARTSLKMPVFLLVKWKVFQHCASGACDL